MRGIQQNLINKKFGLLTVIGLGIKKGTRYFWRCRCSCGNEIEVRNDIIERRTNCGCRRGEKQKKDHTGKKYGRLEVVHPDGKRKWLCQCSCGKRVSVPTNNLGTKTNSCGCLHREVAVAQAIAMGKANIKHGLSKTPEWTTWHNIRQRCENPNAIGYDDYGARGIKVCERWQTFENFIEDMGPRPSDKYSIDRFPNNLGNYEPGNCRWATMTEQQRNRRDNILITHNNQTKCLSAWAEEYKMTRQQLWRRYKAGWEIHEALMTPVTHKNRSRRKK